LASRAYTKKLKLKDSFVNFTLFFIKKKHNCFYLRSQLTPVLHLCVYDESIISVFNILFESILFRFYMFLFPFQNYFTSIASYLISEKNFFEGSSLGAKERRFGADSGWKYEDLAQKYEATNQKTWHGPCFQWHGRATTPGSLLLLLLLQKATYFSLFLT